MRSGLIGRSRPASSAAAVREKLVTKTESGPKRSTARWICLVKFVVLPVPGGPKIRYSAVMEWSWAPIPSSAPVAASCISIGSGIAGLLGRDRVIGWMELIRGQQPPALLPVLCGAHPNIGGADRRQH